MGMLRRLRLPLVVGVLLWATVGPLMGHAQGPNLVQIENQNPGTADWQLGGSQADDINNQIKGYASATSVAIGSSINFSVTVNPAQSYDINVYRIGWYGGLRGRLMASSGS